MPLLWEYNLHPLTEAHLVFLLSSPIFLFSLCFLIEEFSLQYFLLGFGRPPFFFERVNYANDLKKQCHLVVFMIYVVKLYYMILVRNSFEVICMAVVLVFFTMFL